MPEASAHPRRRRTLPVILTLVAVGLVGLTGAYASQALLADDVSLPTITSHGGTLALATNEGGITVGGPALQNLLPGSSSTSTFSVTDTGSIDSDLAFVVSAGQGADASHCFDYTLADEDGTTLVERGSLARPISAALGRSTPGTPRDFKLTVTSRDDCAVNGATGGLTAKVVATQLDGDS